MVLICPLLVSGLEFFSLIVEQRQMLSHGQVILTSILHVSQTGAMNIHDDAQGQGWMSQRWWQKEKKRDREKRERERGLALFTVSRIGHGDRWSSSRREANDCKMVCEQKEGVSSPPCFQARIRHGIGRLREPTLVRPRLVPLNPRLAEGNVSGHRWGSQGA